MLEQEKDEKRGGGGANLPGRPSPLSFVIGPFPLCAALFSEIFVLCDFLCDFVLFDLNVALTFKSITFFSIILNMGMPSFG